MDHLIEYFHSLVEHKFQRDQYEVSFKEGKYHVTITIAHKETNPMSYYIYSIYKKRMERCVEGFIKPENINLQVIHPITLVDYKNDKSKTYRERIDKILRLK